ncbi:unnamed protein product, partial [Allacma fusca]
MSTTKLSRHNGNCEGVLIYLHNFSLTTGFIPRFLLNGNRNTGPYFFLGSKPKLLKLMTTNVARKFKWKFGIVWSGSLISEINFFRHSSVMTEEKGKLINFNIDNFTPKILIRSRLEGHYFPCSTTSIYTFVAWNSRKMPIMGVFYNVILAASKVYNFTFSINHPPGGTNQITNGTWPGAVGDVLYNDKEIILGLGHSLERSNVVDFTSLFSLTELVFLKRRPQVKIQSWAIYMYPYHTVVWILLIVFFLTLSSLIGIELGKSLGRKKAVILIFQA